MKLIVLEAVLAGVRNSGFGRSEYLRFSSLENGKSSQGVS